MPQAGIDKPRQSHTTYEASALPPSPHGWIGPKFIQKPSWNQTQLPAYKTSMQKREWKIMPGISFLNLLKATMLKALENHLLKNINHFFEKQNSCSSGSFNLQKSRLYKKYKYLMLIVIICYPILNSITGWTICLGSVFAAKFLQQYLAHWNNGSKILQIAKHLENKISGLLTNIASDPNVYNGTRKI